jgi:VanZ family protein
MPLTSPRLHRAAFWGCLLAVVVLSLLPGERLPAVFAWWDKAQHALGFAILTGLGLLAYGQVRWRLPAGLLLLGALIELAQGASGWRTGDWRDLLADAVGIVLTLLLWRRFVGERAA